MLNSYKLFFMIKEYLKTIPVDLNNHLFNYFDVWGISSSTNSDARKNIKKSPQFTGIKVIVNSILFEF